MTTHTGTDVTTGTSHHGELSTGTARSLFGREVATAFITDADGRRWQVHPDTVTVVPFDVDDVVSVRVAAHDITAVVLAVSGDLATVQIDMSTYRVPVELCERVAGPDDEHVSACPACGSPIDYCAGHGDIGDPVGASIVAAHHDHGDHTRCHPAGCEVAADYLARSANLTGKF